MAVALIGQVRGVVVDPGGHHVTHVLLQTGRMRGRKEAAIPISAVTKIGTMIIHLSLTRHQVKDRPSGLMGPAPSAWGRRGP